MDKKSDSELKTILGDYVAPEGLYSKTKDLSFLGKVTCGVDSIVAGSWQEIILDYELGAAGMADGSWFKATFRFYSDWALFQTSDPRGANYVSAEYQASPVVPGQSPATVQSLKVRFDQKGHERPFQKAIIVDTVDGYLKAGDHIIIRLGDRRHGGPGTRVQTFVEKNFRIRCYVDPLGTSRAATIPGDTIIQIVPGAPAQAIISASRIVRVNEPLPVRIRVEDQWGNTCWDCPTRVAVTATIDGAVAYEKEVMLAGEGWSRILIEDVPTNKTGDLTITARLSEHPHIPLKVFYASVEKLFPAPRMYYCDLHVHSEDTIGTNSTTYNLTYGRDVSGLDILAFSHNDFNITKDKWDKTVELIHEITQDHAFIGFPGTEWCGSSCAGGDHNVVFLHGQVPEFPYLKTGEHVRSFEWDEEMGAAAQVEPGAWPLEELWAAYAKDPEGHLLIPHVGGRRCILDWHYPTLERLIEIGSSWGHFGWLYQEAIERGYKLGASMAGDEHRGRCGGGVPGTAVFGTKGGISGVLAPELTRSAVAAALRARHTFATTGERTAGLSRCGKHIQGDEFQHKGIARVSYRFLGDVGWDEVVAYDHTGAFWRRDLQEEMGYSGRKIRIRWGGARVKDRYRSAEWRGMITVRGGVINGFTARGFEHMEETCWRESGTQIGFRSDTYGDVDAIEMDVSGLSDAVITLTCSIDGYVKVGDPTKGNPFMHCPTVTWEIAGADLLEHGRLRKDLPGVEMFVSAERMSDLPAPRDVAGEIEVASSNGPHGFRPVYFVGRQVDDSKVWTSAMFIEFT